MPSNYLHNNAEWYMLASGDPAAFTEIYYKYCNAVLRNIQKFIHQVDDAEDILQEVFILLWNKRNELGPEHSIGGWLFSTSYYKSLEHLKRSLKARYKLLTDRDIDEIAAFEENSEVESTFLRQSESLKDAINALSPRKRSAFTLCRIHGKSYEEAAEELGLSVETVKEYVKASMQSLRKYFAHPNHTPTPLVLLLISLEAIPQALS